jgi:hypothetical protein
MKEQQRDPGVERRELEAYFSHLVTQARLEFERSITACVDQALTALKMRERRIRMDLNAALRKLEPEAEAEEKRNDHRKNQNQTYTR